MDPLKARLRQRCIDTYNACKSFGYSPRAFLDMVVSPEDIVETVRRLIYKEGGTSGFATLFEHHRLDLSVEKIILEEEFRPLFTQEDLRQAAKRLEEHGYEFDEMAK